MGAWLLAVGGIVAFVVGMTGGWLMVRLLYGRIAAQYLLAIAGRPASYTALVSCFLLAAWAVSQLS